MSTPDTAVEWGTWTAKLVGWCRHAGVGDGGERPVLSLELNGDGWWEVEARSFYDGYAETRSRDLEEAAKEAYERLTSHPERQLEAEIEQAARYAARLAKCTPEEARQWIEARRAGGS